MRHSPTELWLKDIYDHPDEYLVAGQSVIDGSLMSAKEFVWLYEQGRIPMHDIDRGMVTKMNTALKAARFPVANDGKKIKDFDGNPTRYFQVRQIPAQHPVWADLVKDRTFLLRIVASQSESSSQQDSAGNQDTKY